MTPYPEFQQIIREETDDGRGIVRFLYKAMEGEFQNFTPTHRIMAGRVLGILGVEQGIEFVEANKKPKVPRNSAQLKYSEDEADAELTAAERELSDYTKRVSKNGRRMIRFFLEAMDGLIKSFRPSLRIAAAKELSDTASRYCPPPADARRQNPRLNQYRSLHPRLFRSSRHRPPRLLPPQSSQQSRVGSDIPNSVPAATASGKPSPNTPGSTARTTKSYTSS